MGSIIYKLFMHDDPSKYVTVTVPKLDKSIADYENKQKRLAAAALDQTNLMNGAICCRLAGWALYDDLPKDDYERALAFRHKNDLWHARVKQTKKRIANGVPILKESGIHVL